MRRKMTKFACFYFEIIKQKKIKIFCYETTAFNDVFCDCRVAASLWCDK